MTKPLQGKKFFKFRDRIMGMSKSENISQGRKVRDEIAQKEDFESIQTIRGLESKKLLRQMADWNKHDPNLQECVGKVKTDLRF